jgi:hypothetical protein
MHGACIVTTSAIKDAPQILIDVEIPSMLAAIVEFDSEFMLCVNLCKFKSRTFTFA